MTTSTLFDEIFFERNLFLNEIFVLTKYLGDNLNQFSDHWFFSFSFLLTLPTHLKVFEPRGGGQQAFDEAKNEFTDAVDSGGGGLLLAVFRGKMSEGISFNDNYCRAVFCVGIPFPSTKDLKVQLKMRYNDSRSKVDAGYLSGR